MLPVPVVRARCVLHPCAATDWPAPITPVLRWVIRHESLPQHHLALLLRGGALEHGTTHITLAHDGQADAPPQHWALSYRRPDAQISARLWQLDVGITAEADGWACSVDLRHGVRADFVGAEPPAPERLGLDFLDHWLHDPQWHVLPVASFPLQKHPIALAPGSAPTLRAALLDPARVHPLVYVSCGSGGDPLIDPYHLADMLAGTAVVLVATDPALDNECEWFLPHAFRCVGGAVRVYLPHPQIDSVNDARRHRYLPPHQIATLGSAVTAVLADSILRWAASNWQDTVTTVTDVQTRQRERRLAELRQQAEQQSGEQGEYIALLETDNTDLRRQIQRLHHAVQEAHTMCATDDDHVRRLCYERDLARTQAGQYKNQLDQRAAQQQHVQQLRDLPATLGEMLSLVEALFPTRVRVTARARASAVDAAIGATRDARVAWRMLHALATTLYELLFAEKPTANLLQTFRAHTGIELTLTEGELTKHSARLRDLRYDFDDTGQPIDITPHLKFGVRPPRLLRIHFAIDRDRRLLIIGHCGDHLETAGSRWNAA